MSQIIPVNYEIYSNGSYLLMKAHDIKALYIAALIGLLVTSLVTQSVPQVFAKELTSSQIDADLQLDEFEIVKVRAKQGRTLTILFVKMAEDFGIDIYQFSIKLTAGELKGFKGPRTWIGERDSSDPNAVTFYTKERPITAQNGAIFRILAVNSCPAIEWTAMDQDGEEIDYGTVIAHRSSSSLTATTCPVPTTPTLTPTPMPTPVPMPVIAVRPIEADQFFAGAKVVIVGKGFAANSAVKILFEDRHWTEAKTNDHGTFETRAEIPDVPRGEYKVSAADASGNTARTSIVVHARPDLEPTADLRLKTEKERYVAGEVVVILGHGAPNVPVELSVIDPRGEHIFRTKVDADRDGNFAAKMQLERDALGGMYVVYAKQERLEGKATFAVAGVKPIPVPRPQLSVQTDKDTYRPKDNVVIFGRTSNAIDATAVTAANLPVVEILVIGPTTDASKNDQIIFKGEARVTEDGSYKTMFTLEDARPGTYAVTANYGKVSAHTRFAVVAVLSVPNEPEPNRCPDGPAVIEVAERKEGYVRIDGKNFSPVSTITFTIQSENTQGYHFGRTTSNEYCSFENFWSSISDLAAGTYLITAVDLNGLTASAKIMID